MKKLSGLIAAPHTPFAADGSVNYPVIDKIAEHLIATGVTGAYVLGTTGEISIVLSKNAKKSLNTGLLPVRDN